MSQSMIWRLVAKDLWFNRWLAALTFLAGLVSFVVMGIAEFGFIVGLVLFITSMIVYGIFVGQESLTREHRDKISTFILSLPVSTTQYTVAKLLAAVISYLAVWAALAAILVVLTLRSADAPNGILPVLLAVMGLMLMNFCILLAVGVATTSARWLTATITVTNTAVTLYMIAVFNVPSVQQSLNATELVWPPFVLASFALEAGIIALCVCVTWFTQSRKKDFI